MPVRSPRWPFTAAAVENSPDDWGGVYVLWREDTVLFIGSAPKSGRSIKADLIAHLTGERGDPTQRERELLDEHVERHKAYPRCNEKR